MIEAGIPVVPRIAETLTTLGASRFSLKYSSGHMPHEKAMRPIELYGTRVAPRVREILAGQ